MERWPQNVCHGDLPHQTAPSSGKNVTQTSVIVATTKFAFTPTWSASGAHGQLLLVLRAREDAHQLGDMPSMISSALEDQTELENVAHLDLA